LIYHITTVQAWENAMLEGGYQPSSLSLEGFIHCSYDHQLARTASRYYAGQHELVLLWIDPGLLAAELRVEGGTGDGERFPHIHGPLNLAAVVRVTNFDPDAVSIFWRKED
jgi:uncharacterized protein (DUF952 family)